MWVNCLHLESPRNRLVVLVLVAVIEIALEIAVEMPERRCRLTVMATACIRELHEMALLEHDAEQVSLVFEFAGQKLPESLPLHILVSFAFITNLVL